MKNIFIASVFFFIPSLTWAQGVTGDLTVWPQTGSHTQTFLLDASDFVWSNGEKSGLQYRFKIDQDGTWSRWSPIRNYRYNPEEVGDYYAYVQVRDKAGLITTDRTALKVVPNVRRRAWISTDRTQITAGESVQYKLHFEQKGDDVSLPKTWRWDFDSDGVWDTPFGQKYSVGRAFSRLARHTPTVQIRYDDGVTHQIRGLWTPGGARLANNQKVQVLKSPIQTWQLEVTPSKKAKLKKVFQIKAVLPKHKSYELTWWINKQALNQKKSTFDYQFKTSGPHTITARVCALGTGVCETKSESIEVDLEPISFQLQIQGQNLTHRNQPTVRQVYQSGVVGDQWRFTAQTRSNGTSVRDLQYRWRFASQEPWTLWRSEATAFHQFFVPGQYELLVQAKSSDHDSYQAQAKLIVQIDANTNPEGDFQVITSPDHWFSGQKIGFKPLVYDRESSSYQLKTRWDFDQDGVWDTVWRSPSNQDFTYSRAGKYVISLQIKDPSGALRLIRRQIQIKESIKPQASIDVNYKTGSTDTTFQLDASQSQGQALQYRWQIYGEPNLQNRQGSKISLRFRTLGTKWITLTVIDPHGLTDQVTFPVEVIEGKIIKPAVVPVAPTNNANPLSLIGF